MAKFTVTEIVAMSDPYLELVKNNIDGLQEHQAELESLEYEQKVELITKLLSQCPLNELTSFTENQAFFSSLNQTEIETDTFSSLWMSAQQIAKELYAITNPNNSYAYLTFTDEEFNSDLYTQFPELSKILTERFSHHELATNLAIHTPFVHASFLFRNLRIAFAGNKNFLEAVHEALVLKRLLNEFAGTPLSALKSRDFSWDLLQKYPRVVQAGIKHFELGIARILFEQAESKAFIMSFFTSLPSSSSGEQNEVEQIFAQIYAHYCSLSEEKNAVYYNDDKDSSASEQSFNNEEQSGIDANRSDQFAQNYQRYGFLAAATTEMEEYYSHQPPTCSIL